MVTRKDLDLLRVLADFRLATSPLLAARLAVSEQMIRRRCRNLADCGLLKTTPRNPGQGRGRPEWVFSLTQKGVWPLKKANLLPSAVPADQVTGDNVERMAEHQVFLNWLAVWFAAIDRLGDQLAVRFISSTSPFHLSEMGGTILRDKASFPDGREIVLKPDAAVCITHRTSQRSLLFFLEIDMGTEVVADPKHTSAYDIRRKVIVYRTYLCRRGYKRYEQQEFFNQTFNGFRLLLIAHTHSRCASLCRLVRAMEPTDFVWLCDFARIRRAGISGTVWNRGGTETHLLALLPPQVSGVSIMQ